MNQIQQKIQDISQKGGSVFLPAGQLDIEEPLVINSPCMGIHGEIWCYNSDPNGVFESKYGSKIRLQKNNIPAIQIGEDHTTEGCVLKDFGVQGNIVGMDTRKQLHPENPRENAGLLFANVRTDQGEFNKISFCGLGVAVCASDNAELDACVFTKCNTDGCGVGFWFTPRASYYNRIFQCVMADNPYYGIYANGEGRNIFHMQIVDNYFVRDAGAFEENVNIKAAVCLDHISNCLFKDNLVESPGTYWHYEDNATRNDQRMPQKHKAIGLYVCGDKNRIIGNTFSKSSMESIVVKGNSNILMNNIADGDVVVEGDNNVIQGLIFTKPEGKLIIKGQNNQVQNVDESRIIVNA